MTRRRLVSWVAGGSIALALAAGLALSRAGGRPQLPAVAHYGELPESFTQALQAAREKIRSPAGDPDLVRRLARLYQANRLLREARACYRVVESSPGGLTARDHYYLADIAQNENDLAGAQAELRAVLQTTPGYLPARLALAETLFKTGKEDEAAREYSAIVAIEPNHPQASVGLARIALQKGEDDSAVSRLEKLMASHPESTSGAALLAQVLDRKGDAERAAAMSQWSQQTHEPAPADPWMEATLVDCYDIHRLALIAEQDLTAGQMAEALPLLSRIEELDAKSWIPPILRGWSRERAGRHLEAAQEYRLALQRGGNPEKICPLLGAALLGSGDPTAAATMLAEYRAKLPDSLPILRSSAEVAVRMGDEKLARALLAKVLQAEPYVYLPNMSMVTILWNAGERDQAVLYLERVARVFPADVDSRGLLGQYYLEKLQPWAAIIPLEQAIAHAPAPARERLASMLSTAYLMAGSGEADQGHFAEALGFSEKASRLVPSDLKAYALTANVRRRLKDFPRAAEVLEKMVSLEPGNPTIQLSLGDVIYQAGDKDKARQHWEKALQLAADGDSELRAALDLRLSGHITNETFK